MPRFNFTIQDASPLIAYTAGLWTEGTPVNDSLASKYEGSFKQTNTSDAKVTFNFAGTGVAIFGALRRNHGNYSVDLDHIGNPGNSSSKGDAFKVDLWHAYGLKNGNHTVEVTNIPAAGSYFDVDFISIEREVGHDGDNIFNYTFDDTAANVQYHGTWAPDSTMHAQNLNQTLRTTTTPSSYVVITFRGCCIELYGLYTNTAYSVSVDTGPPLVMQGLDVDLPGDLWHPQTLLYLMDGLSEDAHTVTLTATYTNQQRPFSFDHAVVRSTQSSTNGHSEQTVGNNHKLSHGALVGLAVGLSLGSMTLFCLLVIACLFCRRWPHPQPIGARKTSAVTPSPIPWEATGRLPLTPSHLDRTQTVRHGMSKIDGARTEMDENGEITPRRRYIATYGSQSESTSLPSPVITRQSIGNITGREYSEINGEQSQMGQDEHMLCGGSVSATYGSQRESIHLGPSPKADAQMKEQLPPLVQAQGGPQTPNVSPPAYDPAWSQDSA